MVRRRKSEGGREGGKVMSGRREGGREEGREGGRAYLVVLDEDLPLDLRGTHGLVPSCVFMK